MPSPQDAVKEQLWQAFVAATEKHPRAMILRFGDNGLMVRCLMDVLGEVFAPLVLEVAGLRAKLEKLEGKA